MSEATANELDRLGKKEWMSLRVPKVTTKEKGEIQTHWLSHWSVPDEDVSSMLEGSSRPFGLSSNDDSKQRWIQWNVETFKEVGIFAMMFQLDCLLLTLLACHSC